MHSALVLSMTVDALSTIFEYEPECNCLWVHSLILETPQ